MNSDLLSILGFDDPRSFTRHVVRFKRRKLYLRLGGRRVFVRPAASFALD